MILLSHPTGNANVRHAALALAEAGLLDAFWTGVSWPAESVLNRWIPGQIRRELARRSLPALVRARTRHSPVREAGRMLASKLGWNYPVRHESGFFSIDAVNRALDRTVAHTVESQCGIGAVYAYEDCAAATFEAAKRRGLRTIYDLPIGYWRAGHAIFEEEKVREPEWASTLSGMLDSSEKLARKDAELQAADLVIVASSFTRQTLEFAPAPAKPIAVIPYGSPEFTEKPSFRVHKGRLRVLFVGALGQRKGLSYLLKAVAMMGAGVKLTLLGRKTAENCDPLDDATKSYRWIPSLPHAEVLKEMGRHDVLVFPSLFEGFGLVILEAMSRGIPVITTSHTAGPDIIKNGEDGYIVPIRSSEAIANRLEELAGDSERLCAMKHAAHDTARLFAWQAYRANLVHTVRDSLSGSGLLPVAG